MQQTDGKDFRYYLALYSVLGALSSLLLSGCDCLSRAMTPLVLSGISLPHAVLGLAAPFEMQLSCFSILL